MFNFCKQYAALFFSMLTVQSVFAASAEKISVCGDGAGWPPFHYRDAVGHFRGYDLEVLDRILKPAGIKYEFSMPPWIRCLVGIKINHYQLAVSASFSKERGEKYLFTETYYSIAPVVVAFKGYFKNPVSIEELRQYRVCGVKGYSYGFLKSYGIKPTTLHNNYYDTFDRLNGNPCQLLIARKEVLASHPDWEKAKKNKKNLRITPIENIAPEEFHMLISMEYPEAQKLKTIIDAGIVRLRESGKLDELKAKYEVYK